MPREVLVLGSSATRGVGMAARRRWAGRPARRRITAVRWPQVAASAIEVSALLVTGLILVIAWLGRAALWFSGGDVWSHLVPFAATVLLLAIITAALLRLWLAARRRLVGWIMWTPAVVALVAAGAAAWFATRPVFRDQVDNLRTLVGGKAVAARSTLAHQVFAAYRRTDLGEMETILERAVVFDPTVHEAALAFALDPEILIGVGAAESSFHPRDSADGGRGLFQITAPPAVAVAEARKRLGKTKLDPFNQRHNAFVGAATLRRYLDEMKGDLFLGLLAYNIGPRNGGLRSIMSRYGARDFVTIQPYLQHLPRDYPIRVLSAALAYRIWKTEGTLPRYEQGSNARHIQEIGIPGLSSEAAQREVAQTTEIRDAGDKTGPTTKARKK